MTDFDYTSNPMHELTELIREERYARTLANIARRAENLWDDGYEAKLKNKSAHFEHYTVFTPSGDRYSVCLSYEPNHEVFGDYCSCPSWGKYGACKHHYAVSWQVRDASQADAFDAMMANAEGPHGTDPDMKW